MSVNMRDNYSSEKPKHKSMILKNLEVSHLNAELILMMKAR